MQIEVLSHPEVGDGVEPHRSGVQVEVVLGAGLFADRLAYLVEIDRQWTLRHGARALARPRQSEQSACMSEHAVLLYITALAGDSTGVDEMEDLLIGAIQTAGAGEFDGNAVGPEGAVLYMYGPDADALWAAIESVVRAAPLSPGCYAIKRYGDPGAMEARVDLT